MPIPTAGAPFQTPTGHHGSQITATRTAFVPCDLEPFGPGGELARSIDDALGRLIRDCECIGIALAPVSFGGFAGTVASTNGVLVTVVVRTAS